MAVASTSNSGHATPYRRPNIFKRCLQGLKKESAKTEVDDLADQFTRTQLGRQQGWASEKWGNGQVGQSRPYSSQSLHQHAGPSRFPASSSFPLHANAVQTHNGVRPASLAGDRLPSMPTVERIQRQQHDGRVTATPSRTPRVPDAFEHHSARIPPTNVAVSTPTSQRRRDEAHVQATVQQSRKSARGTELVSDPAKKPGLHQCWGIKRDGTRCLRKIGHSSSPEKRNGSANGKVRRPGRQGVDHDIDSSSGSDSDTGREYCHQHAKEINKTPGFVLPTRHDSVHRQRMPIAASSPASKPHADEQYIDFTPFLSSVAGLPGEESCKARLRAAMTRPPTLSDWEQRGYIYIYELQDRSSATHIALKVGRTTNVFKRFDEWKTQCYSKRILLRAFFPRQSSTQAVLPGASAVDSPGVVLSKKWENLCHIELATLGRRLDDVCNDCGSRHREIFLIPRDAGGYVSACRIISKWLGFVELVAREDGL